MNRALIATLFLLPSALLVAAEPEKEAAAPPDTAALIKKLAQDLTGAKLTGSFTIDGKSAAPKPETYTITSAIKLPEGDEWLIKAKMSYSKDDKPYPIPIEIKWAGDTPVMTMTDMEIPGLGVFSTRVVLYQNRYAGTWQHGKAGGHLFGTIEKDNPGAPPAAEPAPEKK
jgi:hypothetical protein